MDFYVNLFCQKTINLKYISLHTIRHIRTYISWWFSVNVSYFTLILNPIYKNDGLYHSMLRAILYSLETSKHKHYLLATRYFSELSQITSNDMSRCRQLVIVSMHSVDFHNVFVQLTIKTNHSRQPVLTIFRNYLKPAATIRILCFKRVGTLKLLWESVMVITMPIACYLIM